MPGAVARGRSSVCLGLRCAWLRSVAPARPRSGTTRRPGEPGSRARRRRWPRRLCTLRPAPSARTRRRGPPRRVGQPLIGREAAAPLGRPRTADGSAPALARPTEVALTSRSKRLEVDRRSGADARERSTPSSRGEAAAFASVRLATVTAAPARRAPRRRPGPRRRRRARAPGAPAGSNRAGSAAISPGRRCCRRGSPPAVKLSVLAAPIAATASERSSASSRAARLWGTVTLAPTKPRSRSSPIPAAKPLGRELDRLVAPLVADARAPRRRPCASPARASGRSAGRGRRGGSSRPPGAVRHQQSVGDPPSASRAALYSSEAARNSS